MADYIGALLRERVAPLMKEAGFVKRGKAFFRVHVNGDRELIDFQAVHGKSVRIVAVVEPAITRRRR